LVWAKKLNCFANRVAFTRSDINLLPSRLYQPTGNYRTGDSVAINGRNAQQIDSRVGQANCQSPCIINVITNVRVQQYIDLLVHFVHHLFHYGQSLEPLQVARKQVSISNFTEGEFPRLPLILLDAPKFAATICHSVRQAK
jgi:hypothetical protein